MLIARFSNRGDDSPEDEASFVSRLILLSGVVSFVEASSPSIHSGPSVSPSSFLKSIEVDPRSSMTTLTDSIIVFYHLLNTL